jgi:hypothetical protein
MKYLVIFAKIGLKAEFEFYVNVKYPPLPLQMLKSGLIFSSLLLFLIACETAETQEESIPENHAALLGTWQEADSSDTVIWTFDQYEVKWKGFRHYYEVSNDSLIISGLVHKIVEQKEEKIQFLTFDGKLCTLNRKDK